MDGTRHDAYTLAGLGLVGLPLASHDPVLGLGFLLGGTLGTLYLSPDLDVPESRPSRRWGPLSFLWHPYRLLHPHRGASHSYLYGPLSRLVYLGLLLGPLVLALGKGPEVLDLMREAVHGDRRGWVAFLVGYWVSQWAHLWQDGILPWRKRGGRWSLTRLWR